MSLLFIGLNIFVTISIGIIKSTEMPKTIAILWAIWTYMNHVLPKPQL